MSTAMSMALVIFISISTSSCVCACVCVSVSARFFFAALVFVLALLLTSHDCREWGPCRVGQKEPAIASEREWGNATKATKLTLSGSHPRTPACVWAYHTVANSPCAMQHFFSCVLACFVLLRFFAFSRFWVGPTPKAAALLSLSSTFTIAVALTPRLCAARFSISIGTHIYLH